MKTMTPIPRRLVALLACFTVLLVFLPGAVLAQQTKKLGMMVPAYFYPKAGGEWEKLARAAQEVPLIVILNPANGPGRNANVDYQRALAGVRRNGGRVIGYVSTNYGRRPLENVFSDIARHLHFYAIDGVFLDEMSTETSLLRLRYYAAIYSFIKTKNPNLLVVGNPGTTPPAAYLRDRKADIFVSFEDGPGYQIYEGQEWMKRFPASNFAHLVHGTADFGTMLNFVKSASDKHAGYFYCTDDGEDNPWDTLPSYWQAEVDAVKAVNTKR